MSYASVASDLVSRIETLLPAHPEILTMKSAWDLFKVDGFKCDDLEPSFYQASWALVEVQKRNGDRK